MQGEEVFMTMLTSALVRLPHIWQYLCCPWGFSNGFCRM